jgi:hypothetical protein
MRNPIRVKTFSALLILSGASLILFVPQASAGTYCADGTYSYSSGKGTCSWHGGISGGAPSSKKSYGSSLNDPYGLNSYSNKKSYGSSLNDPYGLNSYSNKKSYGSSLNDPYGLNSYSNSRTVKPYGGFGSGAPSRSQMDACAKSAASMYKCATGR